MTATRQRYVRPRTELEDLCCVTACPHEIREQVVVLLAGQPRSVGMCGRHAPVHRGHASV